MRTPEESQVTRADGFDGCDADAMSVDAIFTLVMAACLIVDAALIRLLVAICDHFMLPLLPFVIAGLIAAIAVPFSVGPTLRSAAAQSDNRPHFPFPR